MVRPAIILYGMRFHARLAGLFWPLLLTLRAAAPAEDFTFTTNNAAITITRYTGSGDVVAVPSTISGLPVTSIADWAFYSTGVTNITIPDSVTNIGDGAFFDCESLINVTIGNSVTKIREWTFAFCPSLTSICCRGNAPSVGGVNVFYGNVAIVYYLAATTGWGPTLGGHPAVLWNPPVPYTWATNNGAITITGYSGPGGVVAIPNTINFLPVTSITDYAFYQCTNLTTVTIPNSVTSIGNEAFAYCSSLTSLTIPTGVTNLGGGAFHDCRSLSSLTLPTDVTRIGDFAFAYCSSLASVTMGTNVTTIGVNAFYSCTSLTNFIIPDSVTTIGYQAFGLCSTLTNITVGNRVAYIDFGAFIGCSSLASLHFRGNTPTVDSGSVFEGDGSATAYYLPGTSGWGSWYFGIPSVMLNSPVPAGSLQVTISPARASAEGVRWHVDGGIPQPGGATVLGLSVGNHTVSFSPANPWTTPANQTIFVSANATATATGICTEPVQYQLTYTTNASNNLTLTGYTADLGGAVDIPSEINGRVVTGIGNWAFSRCSTLTSITIPASVISIGLLPFWGCGALTAITVDTNNLAYSSVNGVLFDKEQTTLIEYPSGLGGSYVMADKVATIGFQAFNSCQSLVSVTIGKAVTNTGDWSFGNCLSLRSVYFQGDAPAENYSSFWGDNATAYYLPGTMGWRSGFDGLPTVMWDPQAEDYSYITNNGAITITGYTGSGGAVTIPDKIYGLPVTTIGTSAFYQCTNLTSVSIPNAVNSIGDSAFQSCSNLIGVTIPDGVASIGVVAFRFCGRLAAVNVPSSVTNIGDWAFSVCSNLSAITVDPRNSFYASPDGVLFDKDQATLLQCPSGKPGSYTVPGSVTSIVAYAFIRCASLGSVTIPNSVTEIAEATFYQCTSLTNLAIPNTVANIGDWACYACKSLSSVTIPDAVTNIGDLAFADCAGLRAVTIPNNVTYLGDYAFEACNSLTNVTIGNRITRIGYKTFSYDDSLTTVEIPNSVTNIGEQAFTWCSGLQTATVGSGVTTIGDWAFSICTSLTGIFFRGNAPSLAGASVFRDATNATAYYLAGTIGWSQTFGGLPTAPWYLPNPVILTFGPSFGVQTNAFGFIISWATNVAVRVEASTDLRASAWLPLSTNTLSGGWSYFSDPDWTNHPARFYRLRSP